MDYGIPANDDAIRSVKLLCDFVAAAVIDGLGGAVTAQEMAGEAEAAAAPAEAAPAAEAVAEPAAEPEAAPVAEAPEATEAAE